MSEDPLVSLLAGAVLAAHLAALAWWVRARRRAGVLAHNVALAASVLVAQGGFSRVLAEPSDGQRLALVAFEAVVLAVSAGAISGRRPFVALSFAAFAVHAAACVAVLVFMATCRSDRLF